MTSKHEPASGTPDLTDAINRAIAEAVAYHAAQRTAAVPPEERDRAVDELREWLQSDRLDWDAVERAHRARV